MAAALIPLIAGIAPSVINLISGLVHKHAPVAEQTNGPGTGPVKFADVFNKVIVALQQAAAAGMIDPKLPADETVKAIIQGVVQSMQLMGLLDASAISPAPSSAPPNSIVLTSGQSVTITVK